MPYDLYGGKPPYEQSSETSRQAAESIADSVTELARRVLNYITMRGDTGATNDEIEVALDMAHQTASARTRELVLKSRVRASGLRRRTRSGCEAAVWVAIPSGQTALPVQSRAREPRRPPYPPTETITTARGEIQRLMAFAANSAGYMPLMPVAVAAVPAR